MMDRTRQFFRREPLFRLLAINLAAGIALALLLTGGLLALNPGGLRNLIVADHSPAAGLVLLLFGFVVTFASVAMGSAIMALRARDEDGGGLKAHDDSVAPALQRATASRSTR